LKIVNERFTEVNINKNINLFLIYAKKNDIENVSKYYALMNIFQQEALKIIYFTFQKKYEQIIEMCEQKLLAKKDYAYAIMSAIRINNYNKAHELASKLFDNVDQKECPPFRYGMSLLLEVFSYYKQNQYKEAEDLLEKFKEQSQLKFIYEECQTNYGLSPFFIYYYLN
jgi:tetratricopeptide (TPR) repeat protein